MIRDIAQERKAGDLFMNDEGRWLPVEDQPEEDNNAGSLLSRIVLSIRDHIKACACERRMIAEERDQVVNRIRRETEINQRYLREQMEERRRKLDQLQTECLKRLDADDPDAFKKSLDALTELSLTPTAILEFPSDGDSDEGGETCS